MAGYGYVPEEEREEDFETWPAPLADEGASAREAFSAGRAAPIRPPGIDLMQEPPAQPARPELRGRPTESYERTASVARAQDRDNTHGATQELVNNITNAFTRRPVQGKDRTELFARQRAELASEEGQSRIRAEADPASESSTAYREMVRKAMPEVAEQMGQYFERLTPKQGAQAFPFLQKAWEKESRAAQLKANEEKAQRLREQQLSDEQSRRTFELGRDRDRNQNNLDTAAITAERNAGIRADDRTADAAAKEAEDRRKAGVPGREIVPGFTPSMDSAKKMSDAILISERMKAITKELRELHSGPDGVGTELTGPKAARMDQLYALMIGEGKNIAALGALSGPDMGLVQGMIGLNPASLRANLKGLFRSDNTAAALDGVDKWVNNSVAAADKAFGYRVPQRAQGGRAPPETGMVRIRDHRTGRPAWVNAGDVEPGDEVLNGP